jgi:hypothetical protein
MIRAAFLARFEESAVRPEEISGETAGEAVVVVVWLPICANCSAISTGQTVTGQFSSA